MTEVSELSLLTVESVLCHFKGKRVYFEHMGGNNGDELIRHGSLCALKKAGLVSQTGLNDAELLVVRGGGSMNDFSPSGLKTLSHLLKERPDCPLIVLPQSYKFNHTDFTKLFGGRVAPTYLFSREHYSYDYLAKLAFPPMVKLGIDHDMAMWMMDEPLVQLLRVKSETQHILVVERKDNEGTSGFVRRPFPIPFVKNLFPMEFKKRIKRVIRKNQRSGDVETHYAQSALEEVKKRWPEIEELPVIAADISDPETASFEEFCSLITSSAVVVTNRLHVGVLSAMLGKPTLLREGSYHKITGIYEYSLSEMSHVELI